MSIDITGSPEMPCPVFKSGSARLFLDGKWCDSDLGHTLGVINPATETIITRMAYGGRPETVRALEAAQKAMKSWSKTTVMERSNLLRKTAEILRRRALEIATTLTLEQGKPLAESRGEVLQSADTLDWFAEEGKRAYGRVIPSWLSDKRHITLRHPVGVVAAISPWNFPLSLQIRKLAPALAAGCTVISKPASQTPLCLVQFYECLEEAGLPNGVANLVAGPASEVAAEFLSNPICRKISFTGSTAVGKELMRGASDHIKRLSLELGGHAPFIIGPDADPEMAAQIAVTGKFRNNGQVCIAPSRFYVSKDLRKRFTEAAIEATRSLKVGAGLEPGVQIGPMFEASGLRHAQDLVDEAKSRGARVLVGGRRDVRFDRGLFFEPAVVDDLAPNCRILTEEPFAPILPILEYSQIDEVIEQANNTPYGLAAYAFTNDLSTAWKLAEGLEAGIIGINDPVPTSPQCPFGGMKESGLGRELGQEGLEAYYETKYVSFRIRGS
jgi:succinate-semialdehyde dehydrogenase/glutarate-semialdehyde dehydrogenase